MPNLMCAFNAGAIILAGGDSRRMGANKSLLPIQGLPLIQHIANQLTPHFNEVIVITNNPEPYRFLQLPCYPDLEPDRGPLMGIASGLRHARHDWNLVVATDIPTLPLPLIQQLFAASMDATCVIPAPAGEKPQPLFGLYHRDLADEILTLLAGGQRRVMALIEHCRPNIVPVDTGILANLNTLEAYHAFEERRTQSS